MFLWKITLITFQNWLQIVYASQILSLSKRLQSCTKNGGLPMLRMHYCSYTKSLFKRKRNLHFQRTGNFGLYHILHKFCGFLPETNVLPEGTSHLISKLDYEFSLICINMLYIPAHSKELNLLLLEVQTNLAWRV